MARPLFLWDLFLKLALGVFGIAAALLFWLFTPFFLLMNLLVSWHRLWRYFGVWNLVTFRFIMRRRNLFDTASLPTKQEEEPGDSRRVLKWDALWRTARTADGTFNDLQDPLMGSANTRFARNFSLVKLAGFFKPQDFKTQDREKEKKFVSPNARQISKVLLTRDRFKPASSLNLLAAAWIQFQVHGWFDHSRRPPAGPSKPKTKDDYLPPIPLDAEDSGEDEDGTKKGKKWPGGESEESEREKSFVMRIRRTEDDDSVVGKKFPEELQGLPVYRNTETHWWDGSQLYGSSLKRLGTLRDPKGDGKLKIEEDRRLPQDEDRPGIDQTGFNNNYWAGLSLLHTLFALEHNAICDCLKRAYPDWADERLFQTARLINTALMAKIHTVEWTPAILGHPTLNIGMRANWWGIVTQRFNKILGRLKFLRDIQEEITGIPGSEQDHHAAAFAMTEEFVSVYRMHPLIPDDYRIYTVREDELKIACTLNDLQGDHTREFIKRQGFEDVFYSFGVAHPGSITLKNFPRALQDFKRTHDGMDGKHVFQDPNGKGSPETLDLASVDIMRDRERAIPRYNNFRRMLLLLPCISYKRLVGVPLFPWFSSLTNREIQERKDWARELQRQYPDKEDLDLMLGLFAENRPKGFGFSDTAFRIFVLMAPRRLKSDRFITTDFNPDVYTQLGMDWIENNDFKSVLLRHYPSLATALDDVKNAFTPWQRTERPSPDPIESNPATEDPRPAMRRVAAFQMPIFGGAFIGWIVGAIYFTLKPENELGFFASLFNETAAYGGAIGGSIGGFCLASIYLFTQHRTGEIALPERVQSGAGWGATAGWFIGAVFNLWVTDRVLVPLTHILLNTVSSLVTWEAAIGALVGAGLGAIKERTKSQIRRGVVVGWFVGAAWFLWQKGLVSLGELTEYVVQAGGALGTREALIAAFVGAIIGVAWGGRETIKRIDEETSLKWYWLVAPWLIAPWRVAYGVFFGGVIGAVAGILGAFYLAFAENPMIILPMAGIILILVIAGRAMFAVWDYLSRHDLRWVFSLLTGALILTALGALEWMVPWTGGGQRALLQQGWIALDTLTFPVAAGAAIGALLGVALFWGGWLTLAALAGWLLGGAIEAMLRFQGDIFAADFSSDAGTGTVIGAFLGAALMAFFVRPRPGGEGWMSVGEGWIVVGGVRGALWGFIIGAVYYMWGIASAEGLGAFALEVFTSSPAQWGALIVTLLAGAIWLVHGPEITWILRRSFWNFFGWFKFVGNRPLMVTPPRRRAWWKLVTWLRFFADRRARAAKDLAMKNLAGPVENMWRCLKSRLDYFLRHSKTYRQLDKVPEVGFSKKFHIPNDKSNLMDNIRVSGATPSDERSGIKTLAYQIQVHLYSVFSPMQPEKKGLPPISADPHEALKQAYRSLQRRALDAPDLPPEYEGSPDLGSLAVRGPYSAYLQKVKDSADRGPQFEWDLRELDEDKYELHKGLYSLGIHVRFCVEPHASRNTNLLVPYCIEYRQPDKTWRPTHPWDTDWQFAKKLALCAVTTHQSLVRHFNWVHLAGGEPFAIATRTCLPSDHPLCRLLWPHIYGTQQSNTVVTRGQMVEGGDFETTFSFTHKGMCDLFTETYSEFNLDRYDPRKDAEQRGVRTHLQNAGIETTSQGNLEDLFEVIHLHTRRYLLLYYQHDGNIMPDKDVQDWGPRSEHPIEGIKSQWQEDKDLQAWLAKLKELISSHRDLPEPHSLEDIARLLAQFIYLVTVEHDKCGAFLWNYQLWSHRQPCRVYEKGTREPLDVYQRLVNANFNLNVPRLALMEDFSYLALDDAGAAAFRQFQNDLETLQKEMEKEPWAPWKIYPKMLEANINA